MKYTIKEVNNFAWKEYMDTFPNIIEHCPKFAKVLYERKPFTCRNDVILTLYEYLENLETEEKQAMLTHHPDLTGIFDKSLAEQPIHEQKLANLSNLTNEERTTLLSLNTRYSKQFGFPFVICTQGNNCKNIIKMLETRLQYSQEEEIHNGIGEVKKISTLRILDLIVDD